MNEHPEQITAWNPLDREADDTGADVALELMSDAMRDLKIAEAVEARLKAGEILWGDEAIAAGMSIDRAREIRTFWRPRPDQ